jgi:hypothetical protein
MIMKAATRIILLKIIKIRSWVHISSRCQILLQTIIIIGIQ